MVERQLNKFSEDAVFQLTDALELVAGDDGEKKGTVFNDYFITIMQVWCSVL